MSIIESLNIKKHCNKYRVGLWECPQFLFVLMGIIICFAIFTTYIVGRRFYDDPEIVALIILIVASILFIIGHSIIMSFERIAKVSRDKSEFIDIMSHEMRSPLSTIKWQSDVLLSDKSSPLASLTEATRYLEIIYEQNEKMINVVNDLLEINKIEDKELVLRPSLFSLEKLTRSVVLRNEKYALSGNIKININIQENDTAVFADEERIKRVVGHLIDNAIRYSVEGGEVHIIIKQKEEFIYWEVANIGTGIVPEEYDRIFDKFFRSQSAMRFQTEGTGIGLFIAKSIITMSRGSIGFKSSRDKQTIFWFTLPRSNKKV